VSENNLHRDEARERARLLTVSSYDVELDLTDGSGEKPGETTASASGLVTVRYQWSDGAVHMLDPLPAVITG